MIYLRRRILGDPRVMLNYRVDSNKPVQTEFNIFSPACKTFCAAGSKHVSTHRCWQILFFFLSFSLLLLWAEKLPKWKLNYLQLCVKWRARFSPRRQIMEASREQLGWSFPLLEVQRERMEPSAERRPNKKCSGHTLVSHTSLGMRDK